MTKQEIIREAWGAHYESVRYNLDSNGWCRVYSYMESAPDIAYAYDLPVEFVMEECEHKLDFFRPLELLGLEFNNGWTKIETEDDIPKEGKYRVYPYGRTESVVVGAQGVLNLYKMGRITHFKPLIIEKPPRW